MGCVPALIPGWGDRRFATYNHTLSVSNDRCTTTVFLSARQALLMLLPSRTGSYRCRLKFCRAIRPINRSGDTLIRDVIAGALRGHTLFARIRRGVCPRVGAPLSSAVPSSRICRHSAMSHQRKVSVPRECYRGSAIRAWHPLPAPIASCRPRSATGGALRRCEPQHRSLQPRTKGDRNENGLG